jgi:hypothetical protein
MRPHAVVAAVLVALAALVGPLGALSTAADASRPGATGVVARQTAPACLVGPTGTEECFSSVAAMQVHSSALVVQGTLTCSVVLWSGANYTGQALGLTQEAEWMNLANYGFANAAVSFSGSGCGFHLAQGVNGGGYWYPGNTGPGASCPNMGAGWNDTIQSVYID